MTLETDRRILDGIALDDAFARYAAVVDGQEWHQWPDLFSEECSYAVYSLENVEQGLPLAYMLDDNRARIMDRVKFVTEVWAGSVEPYRTRHLIQRTHTESIDSEPIDSGAPDARTYRVRATMVVTYTEFDGVPSVLASGYYDDLVRLTGDGALFVTKNVYLDGMPARYLVYPL